MYLILGRGGGGGDHSRGGGCDVGLAEVDRAEHQALVAALVAAEDAAGPAVVAPLNTHKKERVSSYIH